MTLNVVKIIKNRRSSRNWYAQYTLQQDIDLAVGRAMCELMSELSKAGVNFNKS